MRRSSNTGGHGRGKSAYGGSSQPGFGETNHVNRETLVREQNIWTKYILNLSTEKQASQ
jgi:hypothetical protein